MADEKNENNARTARESGVIDFSARRMTALIQDCAEAGLFLTACAENYEDGIRGLMDNAAFDDEDREALSALLPENLLPALAGLGNRPMTETEAAARISELQESNIKQAVAAPYFDPAAMPAEDFLALRDAKLAALAETAHPMRIVGGAVLPFSYCLAHARC